MKLPLKITKVVTLLVLFVACGPSKQEKITVLNQRILRLNELIDEQNKEIKKINARFESGKEQINLEVEKKSNHNLEVNRFNSKMLIYEFNMIEEWKTKSIDSLLNVTKMDSTLINKSNNIIDSLLIEINNCKNEVDMLIGLK